MKKYIFSFFGILVFSYFSLWGYAFFYNKDAEKNAICSPLERKEEKKMEKKYLCFSSNGKFCDEIIEEKKEEEKKYICECIWGYFPLFFTLEWTHSFFPKFLDFGWECSPA